MLEFFIPGGDEVDSGNDVSPESGGGAYVGDRNRLALSLHEPLSWLILGVGLLGLASFFVMVASFGVEPWPAGAWLGLIAACAALGSFPYRVNRPGESYYFIDFDEILLVLSLLYVGPPATIAVLVVGYLVGAVLRRTSGPRMIFNSGSRALAVSGAFLVVGFVPTLGAQPWDYLLQAGLAALVYSFINQLLVSQAISLLNGRGLLVELGDQCLELMRSWPIVVSYGLLVGVAAANSPVVLVLAAIPVILLVAASRLSQQRHDEHVRMRGLYGAAHQLHEARSDEDVLNILRESITATLAINGTNLRAQPPIGEELGAWLPNRNGWVIVPHPVSPETRRQDDAFLQALASLVDAGMERATLVGELERQSLRDPLTNSFNRRYFHQALSAVLEQADKKPGCLALLDIDHFKVINDTFGHEVGDNALKELVKAATEVFRVNDVLCRLGGDEFALILPGLTPAIAVERLEALRVRLAEIRPGEPGRGPVGFRTSMGVASFPEHGLEPGALLRSADQALYRAKHEGRDRVVVSRAGLRAE